MMDWYEKWHARRQVSRLRKELEALYEEAQRLVSRLQSIEGSLALLQRRLAPEDEVAVAVPVRAYSPEERPTHVSD